MGLQEAFQKAATAAINAAGNVAKESKLIIASDDGWGESGDSETEYDITLIYSSFKRRGQISQTIAGNYSFSDLVMDGDVKGLMASSDVPDGVSMAECVHQRVKRVVDDQTFTIEGYDIDAATALYVLLLRKS